MHRVARSWAAGVVFTVGIVAALGTGATFADATTTPKFVASPTVGLVDNETINFSGTGWPAGGQVGVFECTTDVVGLVHGLLPCNIPSTQANQAYIPSAPPTYVTAGADGSVSGTTTVARGNLGFQAGPPGSPPRSCGSSTLDDSCYLLMISGSSLDNYGPPFVLLPIKFAQPQVHVTPSSDLVDGQTISISATGMAASAAITVIECPNSAFSVSAFSYACNAAGEAHVTSSATGTLTAQPFTVHTGLMGAGYCQLGSLPCAIGLVAFDTGGAVLGPTGSAPVGFAGSKLTATPSSKLVDNQSITFAGVGFPADEPVSLYECNANLPTTAVGDAACDGTGSGVPLAQTTTTGTGTVAGTASVVTGPVGGSGGALPHSCGTSKSDGTCYLELETTGSSSPPIAESLPVTFVAPGLKATPTKGLVGDEELSFSGSGMPSNSTATLLECNASVLLTPGLLDACDTVDTTTAMAGSDGVVPAGTFIARAGTIGNGTCGTDASDLACLLVLADVSPGGSIEGTPATLPITFVLPAAKVSPSTKLVPSQPVSVTGTGFPAGQHVLVTECNANVRNPAVGAAACDVSTSSGPGAPTVATAGATGALSATAFETETGVVGTIGVGSSPGTCGTVPTDTSCDVAVWEVTGTGPSGPVLGDGVILPVTFTLPTLSASPTSALTDGKVVAFTGSGFPVGATTATVECNANVTNPAVGAAACNFDPAASEAAPVLKVATGTGGVTGAIAVTAGTVGSAGTGAAPGTCGTTTHDLVCYLGTWPVNGLGQPLGGGEALKKVTFSPPATTPTVTATPGFSLVYGSNVTVTASGYLPGEHVLLEECAAAVLNLTTAPQACNTTIGSGPGQAVAGITTSHGGLTAVYSVASGTVGNYTCGASGPDSTCYLVVTGVDGSSIPIVGQQAKAPITFLVSTAPPTVQVSPSTGLSQGSAPGVTGAGFLPNETVLVEECNANLLANDPYACVVAQGSFAGAAQLETANGVGAVGNLAFIVKTGQVGDGTCGTGPSDATCYIKMVAVNSNTDMEISNQVASTPITFGS